MKILVIFTGGTIGSKVENSTIDVKPENMALINLYNEKYENCVDFNVISPINILSENISAAHWEVLIDCVNNSDPESYDGVIITHGSDTLSYTSALLGLYFSNIKVPMVLVASNYTLTDSRSNGVVNFAGAVDFIRNGINGVFAVYKNHDGRCFVHCATRLREADSYFDDFSSFGGAYGEIINGDFHILNKYDPVKFNKKGRLSFKNKVKIIFPYPSIDYRKIDFDEDTKAVLHVLYHSGTACACGENNILSLIEKCKEKGIDFYVCSVKYSDEMYKTSRLILDKGAIPMYNINVECAYAKLLLMYN